MFDAFPNFLLHKILDSSQFGNNNRTYVRYNKTMTRRKYDWNAIQEYHDQGHGFRECRERFGVTHFSWVRAIAAGRLRAEYHPTKDCRRRYDWAEVQAFYETHTYRETQLKFGFAAMSWHKAKLRGEIKSRGHVVIPIDQLIVGRRNRTHLKGRLIRAGILENRCEECGLSEWRGRRLSVHIDHINGVKNDNRLENLRMLCPNCHSQTETYSGKNMRRFRSLQDPPEVV
jgi:hypothetical protein